MLKFSLTIGVELVLGQGAGDIEITIQYTFKGTGKGTKMAW